MSTIKHLKSGRDNVIYRIEAFPALHGMNDEHLISLVEALLFVAGEKLTVNKIAKITGLSGKKIEKAVFQLQLRLRQQKRGIQLLKNGQKVELVTAQEWYEYVEKLAKEALREDLTASAQETLAIVAYNAPVSKTVVDDIRGVDSSFALRTLMVRGLVERAKAKKGKGRYIYKPSLNFYKFLGIREQKELPDYDKHLQFLAEISGE